MAQLTPEAFLMHRRAALLAAIDGTPELLGAGLIAIIEGKPHLLRPSVHISLLETYVILELSQAVSNARDFVWNTVKGGAKATMDHLVKIPGKKSSWDAQREFLDAVVAQPITSFVNRPDFASGIAPKLVGLGLAQIGLVLAFTALGSVATGGTLALVVAGASIGVAVAGYGVAVVALYTQIVDPSLMKAIEDSQEWSTYQKILEASGYVTSFGMAAEKVGAGVLRQRLVDLLKRIAAKQQDNRRMTVLQVADKVNALTEKQFNELCDRLAAHHFSRKAAVRSGAKSLRAAPALPPAIVTRSVASPFARAAAVQIRKEWATRLRKDLFRALCAGSVEGVKMGLRAAEDFMTDKATWIAMTGSALPQSVSGPSSGMINDMLKTMHCYVVQNPPESRKAMP